MSANEVTLAIYRTLAADNPERYGPDLASSLYNLSRDLRREGRDRDTLSADEECVRMLSHCAAVDSAMCQEVHGRAARDLRRRYDGLGEHNRAATYGLGSTEHAEGSQSGWPQPDPIDPLATTCA